MSEVVIRAEQLGKRYRIGEREVYRALRHVLGDALKSPLRIFCRATPSYFWALKDVSLEVREGEVLGLIGRNGAGKTTLLKILSRITRPTDGHAEIHGRVGSLLEVGTGFHPELTGRENTYLSGAILGMRKNEIDAKFESIVDFAEIEKFLDTPVKHYSSGMFVRLAFSVAAHLEPDILLVDEVLAVGDIAFQKKCLGKMGDVAHRGRTVIFVSHQMNQIRRLCQRVVWFDAGHIRANGPTAEVVSAYEAAMAAGEITASHRAGLPNEKARFLRWEIVEPRGSQPNVLNYHGPLAIKFIVRVNEPVRDGQHGIALYDSGRQLLWGTAVNHLQLESGIHKFLYSLPTLPLRPGVYSWRVTLFDEQEMLDDWDCAPEFLVATEPVTHWKDEWAGILNIPSRFSVSSMEPVSVFQEKRS
ncbi:MAG: ABC transporter ATP-binding protein [Acidobacteria bacterium]|nr:ABC transporter ATP-binding protein [Acidobacteriota bacterium]